MTERDYSRRIVLAAGSSLGVAALASLAAKRSQAAEPALGEIPDLKGRIPVAFVMGGEATMIDFAGPWEVFQDLPESVPGCYLYTVADSTSELSTGSGTTNGRACGFRFRPDYDFSDAPQPKVIVIGAQSDHTPAKIDWIRRASTKADYILSVCTGAFLLAETGLLDGVRATTHHQFFEDFEKQFPKVKLVRDARYVDNGRILTASGLTSGIDGALHIVERMFGRELARQVVSYMEYSGDGWRTNARA